MGGLLSIIPGEGTYTNLGDTDGFFSSYLQQPSDTQASLFRKSASQFLSMLSLGSAPLNIFTYKLGRSNEGSVLDILPKSFYESKGKEIKIRAGGLNKKCQHVDSAWLQGYNNLLLGENCLKKMEECMEYELASSEVIHSK